MSLQERTGGEAAPEPAAGEPQALEWSDLRVILAVCRAGSLSGAARALGQNHSTVFRRINAIERRTGVRFFERRPDGYFMTDAGETALACAERVEAEFHALGREILGQDARLQGKVRLTAPEGLATVMAPRILAEFCRKHPGVTVEIDGGQGALDLTRREADIAIRAARQPPDVSLARRVCRFRFAIYGTREYLDAHRHVPLPEHDYCILPGIVDWLVPHLWRKKEQGERRAVFVSPITLSTLHAAVAGLGLTPQPCYIGDADPRLVRATDPIEARTLDLWLLTHPDLRHTARVKAMLSFLFDAFSAEQDLFDGSRPQPGWTPPYRLPG